MKGQIRIYDTTHDSRGYVDEQSFQAARLTKPETINAVLTHLGGKESNKYPITYLTEGQRGGINTSIEIQDAQFMWDVMERSKKSDFVVGSQYAATDRPGIGDQYFYVTFASRHLIEQTVVVSKSGVKARIMEAPIRVPNGFQYTLQITSTAISPYVPAVDIAPGAKWAMVSPGIVSESDSMGNRSNDRYPGKMKNQLTFMRSSYRYGGNVANTTVEVTYITSNGKKTSLYLDYKDYEHEMLWRENTEEFCFESNYNRKSDGSISLTDQETGKPIPVGAGLNEQVANEETYGELTFSKLNNVIGDVAYGATDSDNMKIALVPGKGFVRDFDAAMKDKALSLNQIQGDKYVEGSGRNLKLTGFFKAFEHVDGHTIILSNPHPMFDFGGRAQAADIHPISGFPITSHEAIFLDFSDYDGARNIQMVAQKGRSFLRGVKKGMAPLGGNFGFANVGKGNMIATEQDTNSVHFFGSKAINISRNEFCLRFISDLS